MTMHPQDVERALNLDPAVRKVSKLLQSSGLIGYKLICHIAKKIPCKDLKKASNIVTYENKKREKFNISVPVVQLPPDFDFVVNPKPPAPPTPPACAPKQAFPFAKPLASKPTLPKIQINLGSRRSAVPFPVEPSKPKKSPTYAELAANAKTPTRHQTSSSSSESDSESSVEKSKQKSSSPKSAAIATRKREGNSKDRRHISRSPEPSKSSKPSEKNMKSSNQKSPIPSPLEVYSNKNKRRRSSCSLERKPLQAVAGTSRNTNTTPTSNSKKLRRNTNSSSSESDSSSTSSSSSSNCTQGKQKRRYLANGKSRSPERKSRSPCRRQNSSSSSESSASSSKSPRNKRLSSYRQRERSRGREFSRRTPKPKNQRSRSRSRTRSPSRSPTLLKSLKIPSIFPQILRLQADGKYSGSVQTAHRQLEFEEQALVEDLKIWRSRRLELESDEVYKEAWNDFWYLHCAESEAKDKTTTPDTSKYLKEWATVWEKKVDQMLKEKFEKSLKELRTKHGFDMESIERILSGQPQPLPPQMNVEPQTAQSGIPLQLPKPVPPPAPPLAPRIGITNTNSNGFTKPTNRRFSRFGPLLTKKPPLPTGPPATLSTVSKSWEKLTGLKVKLPGAGYAFEEQEAESDDGSSVLSPIDKTPTIPVQTCLDDNNPIPNGYDNGKNSPVTAADLPVSAPMEPAPVPVDKNSIQNVLKVLVSFGDQMSTFLQPKIQHFYRMATDENGISLADPRFQDLLAKCRKRLEIMAKLLHVPPETKNQMNQALEQISQLIPNSSPEKLQASVPDATTSTSTNAPPATNASSQSGAETSISSTAAVVPYSIDSESDGPEPDDSQCQRRTHSAQSNYSVEEYEYESDGSKSTNRTLSSCDFEPGYSRRNCKFSALEDQVYEAINSAVRAASDSNHEHDDKLAKITKLLTENLMAQETGQWISERELVVHVAGIVGGALGIEHELQIPSVQEIDDDEEPEEQNSPDLELDQFAQIRRQEPERLPETERQQEEEQESSDRIQD